LFVSNRLKAADKTKNGMAAGTASMAAAAVPFLPRIADVIKHGAQAQLVKTLPEYVPFIALDQCPRHRNQPVPENNHADND